MGAAASPASDKYAVGVMAFELPAGQHPFGSLDEFFTDRVFDDEPDLSLLGVADPVVQIINRLLTKTPETRYGRVQEVDARERGRYPDLDRRG